MTNTGRNTGGDKRPRRTRRPPATDRGPRRVAESLDEVLSELSPPLSARPAAAASGGAGARPGTDEPRSRSASGGGISSATWATLFARWEDVVGPAAARHVRPLRVDGDALVVAVDLPPWATQVRALSAGILSRIAELGGQRLERVEVVVRPLTGR